MSRVRIGPLAVVVLALMATACGGASPSPAPGTTTEIVNALVRQGVTIESAVSGESACTDPELTDNALHLTVAGPGTSPRTDLYLYVFRPREFDAAAASIASCAEEYGQRAGTAADLLAVAPYRALGVRWTPPTREAITAALREAAAGP